MSKVPAGITPMLSLLRTNTLSSSTVPFNLNVERFVLPSTVNESNSIDNQRQKHSRWRGTTVVSGIIWQDSREKQSVTASQTK